MTTKTPPLFRIHNPLTKRTDQARIQQQEQIRVTAVKSASFGTQVKPLLDAWNQATDQLSSVLTQIDAARQALTQLEGQRQLCRSRFVLAERGYQGAVQIASQGDPDIIRSLGFEALAGREPSVTSLATPTDLVAKPGADPGGVHLRWTKVKGARSYQIQQSVDPVTATSWQSLDGSTRVTARLGDLVPGQKYWFRVGALGALGASLYSAAVPTTAR